MATKVCAVVPNSCVSSARNVLHVSLLAPRFLKNLYTPELSDEFNFGPYKPTYIVAEIGFIYIIFKTNPHTKKTDISYNMKLYKEH